MTPDLTDLLARLEKGEWPGFIQFTFCDHEVEQFVTLGRTPRMTPAHLAEFFAALPPPNDPDSPFLADLWSDGDCHDDDRAVIAAAIERVLGAPLDELLARGREDNAYLQAELARRSSRTRRLIARDGSSRPPRKVTQEESIPPPEGGPR